MVDYALELVEQISLKPELYFRVELSLWASGVIYGPAKALPVDCFKSAAKLD